MTFSPLILVTNDDGIESPGLLAAAQAAASLGDILIVAPNGQQTGAGRSFIKLVDHRVYHHQLVVDGEPRTAYSLKGSPAQAVMFALLDLAPRPVDLVISGINFGANIGSGITISGTVGAALEAASAGIPALAVSLETPVEYHNSHSRDIDFTVAAHFTQLLAEQTLKNLPFPDDVDVLKVDIPATATRETPWRLTRVSRQAYHFGIPAPPEKRGIRVEPGYFAEIDYPTLESDSDIHAVCVDEVVSVSPLSVDLTSRTQFDMLEAQLRKINHLKNK